MNLLTPSPVRLGHGCSPPARMATAAAHQRLRESMALSTEGGPVIIASENIGRPAGVGPLCSVTASCTPGWLKLVTASIHSPAVQPSHICGPMTGLLY